MFKMGNHTTTRSATPAPPQEREALPDTPSTENDTTTQNDNADQQTPSIEIQEINEQNPAPEGLEDGYIMIGTTAWPLGESHKKLKIPNPNKDMQRAARRQFDIMLRQISHAKDKPSALKHTLRNKWERIKQAAENNSLNAISEKGKPTIITKQIRFYKEGHNYDKEALKHEKYPTLGCHKRNKPHDSPRQHGTIRNTNMFDRKH